MMRILQICNKAPYPANDGSSIAIYTLACGLADNGAELHLLAINTKKHFKADQDVSPDFKKKTNYKSVYTNANPTVVGALLNLFSSKSYFVSRFYFKDYKKALIDILQNHEFDVIQIEGVFMAVYYSVIRKYSKAKIVLRAHNVEHQIWERHLNHEKNRLKKLYLSIQNKRLKKFELEAFNTSDAIVPITDIDKENIFQLSGKKDMWTCLTGIELDQYVFHSKPTYSNTIFHFASMDWLPNIEAVDWFLNEVWPLIKKKNASVSLVLAGRNMPERIKKLKDDQITIKEIVKSSSQFYQDYDIMLVPLWSGSGLRIKLVEGLAYGKPIVSTSIGAEGVPYQAGKNILIADDAVFFSEKVLELLNEKDKKQELSFEARKLAEEAFDYKNIAKKLLEFYNNLI